MSHRFSREELLLGTENLEKLKNAHVAVFGAGGVGGYVIEALARSGVGAITVVDGDRISLTNCNRQLLALESTLGTPKAAAAAGRIREIFPECRVTAVEEYFTAQTAGAYDFARYSYVVDAIDTVTSKLLLIEKCREAGTPVLSCMGTGNKFDPMAFRVADISETSVCPLCRVMRKELKKRGIEQVKVVYSPEEPRTPLPLEGRETKGPEERPVPGSMAFVPAAAGLLMAAQVIGELTGSTP